MAKYVYYHANIYNNRTQSNLGLRKITTLMCENAEGEQRSWDGIDAADICPNYQGACKYFGVGKFLLLQIGNGDTPSPLVAPNVDSIVETSSYIILRSPSDAQAGETLWTLTFPELGSSHKIEIVFATTNFIFNFYINNSLVGYYYAYCGYSWSTSWGYYGCDCTYSGFPCLDSTGDYVTTPFYIAFVAYRHDLLLQYPEIKKCTIGCYSLTDSSATWKTFFGDFDPIDDADSENPYDNLVDDDNHGGEDTNFADNSDTVEEDALPSINAIGTGFATIFTPSKQQLYSLSRLFWDSNFFTFMQNLVENVEDMFTSLAMVPFTVTQGATVEVTWFGFSATGIYLTLAAEQYFEFDMGSINLNDDNRIFKYDNCLDYSPFSKLGIYLPFIGFQDLDIDECRNKTIHLVYRIDILSGACVALIKLNGATLYQFSGNCLTQIPITSESMASAVSDVVNVGIAAASARVAGAASAADAAAAESSDKMSQAQKDAHKMHARVSQTNADNHLKSACANASMGLKPQFNKTGSVSSSVSMLSVKQPYLFLTTSKLSIPGNYQHYAGFPCNMTGKLNTFSGYTVVESIRLNDLVATTPEVEEIYQLLKEGVII